MYLCVCVCVCVCLLARGAGSVGEERERVGQGTFLAFMQYSGGLSCPHDFLVLLFLEDY